MIAASIVLLALAQNPGRGNAIARVLTPSGVGEIADDHYLVKWEDDDELVASPSATLDLFYSPTNTAPFRPGRVPDGIQGMEIARTLAVRDHANELEWRTSSVAPGAYFLWARTYDPEAGRPLPMISFSPGVVVVAHAGDPVAPAVILLPPANPFTWPQASSLEIRYAAFDPDHSGTVRIDGTSPTSEALMIADGLPAESDGLIVWDTSSLAEGEYILKATITDARGMSFAAFDRYARYVNPFDETEPDCGCTSTAKRSRSAPIAALVLLAGWFQLRRKAAGRRAIERRSIDLR